MKTIRDKVFDGVQTVTAQYLPKIDTDNFPPLAGRVAYDVNSETLCYGDDKQWKCLDVSPPVPPGVQSPRLVGVYAEDVIGENNPYLLQDTFDQTVADFQGSVSGNVLTVSSINFGTINIGNYVFAAGLLPITVIEDFGTGTGGVGTYIINSSQTVGSTQMYTFFTYNNSSFNGTIAGTTLTVNSIMYGDIYNNQFLYSGGVAAGTKVLYPTGVNTWEVSTNQFVGPSDMYGTRLSRNAAQDLVVYYQDNSVIEYVNGVNNGPTTSTPSSPYPDPSRLPQFNIVGNPENRTFLFEFDMIFNDLVSTSVFSDFIINSYSSLPTTLWEFSNPNYYTELLTSGSVPSRAALFRQLSLPQVLPTGSYVNIPTNIEWESGFVSMYVNRTVKVWLL